MRAWLRDHAWISGLADVVAPAGAVVTLWAVLALPNRASDLGPAAFAFLPLELPGFVLLAALLPRRGTKWLVALSGGLLVVGTLSRLFDMGTFAAFGRPANPLLDLHLLAKGWELIARAMTPLGAGAAVAVAAALIGVAVTVAGWGLAWLARTSCAGRRQRFVAGALAAALLVAGGVEAGRLGEPADRLIRAHSSRMAVDRLQRIRRDFADLARFERALSRPLPPPPAEGPPLAWLDGADVVVVFVESLGRTALTQPPYRAALLDALEGLGDAVAAQGLRARSAWLESPTVGGQSWLAHASLLSGLRIDSQARYRRLLASDRPSLVDRFAAQGYRTAAVMPAITRDWAGARRYFGYDTLLDAGALSYAGKPYGWPTMPDQVTLKRLHERLLAPADRGPVFAQVALISSHAPFRPLPPRVPWEAVGDGQVFDGPGAAAPEAAGLWGDPARLKRAYRDSLVYELEILASYFRHYGLNDTLLLILGDHEPAPVLTGDRTARQVPGIAIAGRRGLLAPFARAGWPAGTGPAAGAPVAPMRALSALLRPAGAGAVISPGPVPTAAPN